MSSSPSSSPYDTPPPSVIHHYRLASNGQGVTATGHAHHHPPPHASSINNRMSNGKSSSFVPFPLTSPHLSAGCSYHVCDGRTSSGRAECERIVERKAAAQYHPQYRGDDVGRQDDVDEEYHTSRERRDAAASRSTMASANRRTNHRWQITSLFSGNNSSPTPRTPPPRSPNGPMSPPEPRRIHCGTTLFRDDAIVPPTRATGSETRDSIDEEQPSPFPVQARYQQGPSKPIPIKAPLPLCHHEVVGHPSLKIHRMRLPSHLLPLLDTVVSGCEMHASTLRTGWQTDLYSLTKQDIALREIPHIYNAARPVVTYIKRAAALVYGASCIRMDKNQPHVLKYSCEDGGRHTGVELHHDKCDYTANLMLSRGSSYAGGGTYFPDADEVVRLEFGEFLLHPGGLVHGGVNISRGTRYLMVLFAHEK